MSTRPASTALLEGDVSFSGRGKNNCLEKRRCCVLCLCQIGDKNSFTRTETAFGGNALVFRVWMSCADIDGSGCCSQPSSVGRGLSDRRSLRLSSRLNTSLTSGPGVNPLVSEGRLLESKKPVPKSQLLLTLFGRDPFYLRYEGRSPNSQIFLSHPNVPCLQSTP